MTLPAIPSIADEDRYQVHVITSSTPYVDLQYPVFGGDEDLALYIDGIPYESGWALQSISGVDLSLIPLPLTDGRIAFDTPLLIGTLEIKYRWRPRQEVMASSAGITRREFNYMLASLVASQRENYRDIQEIINLVFDFAAYGALKPDVAGPLAGRSAYDLQAAGFMYLQTDHASGAPVVYVKLSATSADWSAALSLRGGAGSTGATGDAGMLKAAGGGTANAITAAFTPSVVALTNGLTVLVNATAANTLTNPTFQADATPAKTIVKGANQALEASDISGADYWVLLSYDSSLDKWVLLNPARGVGITASIPPASTVRQTVQAGPSTSIGLPDFLPASSVGLTITSQNVTSTAAFTVSSAGGYGSTGAADRIGRSTSNITWSGLTNTTTNYLFVTVNSDGTLTTGSTTVAPVYQYAGAASVSLGYYTFLINEMKMYLGNGATASAVNVVFVGEAITSGGNVTSTAAYAYNGFYEFQDTSALSGGSTATTKNHNLGVSLGVRAALSLVNSTSEASYAIGDVVDNPWSDYGGPNPEMIQVWFNTKVVGFTTGSVVAWLAASRSSPGARVSLTAASWRYRLHVRRAW